jgi:hypothetical protein
MPDSAPTPSSLASPNNRTAVLAWILIASPIFETSGVTGCVVRKSHVLIGSFREKLLMELG